MGKGNLWNGGVMHYYQITTGFFKQVEPNLEYAKIVFNEMIARGIPAQLLSISIDGVDIINEYTGRGDERS